MRKTKTITVNEKGLLATDLGDEMIIMDLNSGDYIGLDAVGVSIWTILKESSSIDIIVHRLQQEYAIDEATCQKDVIEFLEELAKKKIITIQ